MIPSEAPSIFSSSEPSTYELEQDLPPGIAVAQAIAFSLDIMKNQKLVHPLIVEVRELSHGGRRRGAKNLNSVI